jgi:hypothetical protein
VCVCVYVNEKTRKREMERNRGERGIND